MTHPSTLLSITGLFGSGSFKCFPRGRRVQTTNLKCNTFCKKLTHFVKNVTNFVKNVTNFVKNVANFVNKLTNFVKNVTNFVKNVTNFVKNVTNFVKNVKIVECHDHIWNHHVKYIEISTNMPGIGSVIRELVVKI